MRDINFLQYTLPTYKAGEIDVEWLESLQIINDDLHWLLSQSHWLFWSQVFLVTWFQSGIVGFCVFRLFLMYRYKNFWILIFVWPQGDI